MQSHQRGYTLGMQPADSASLVVLRVRLTHWPTQTQAQTAVIGLDFVSGAVILPSDYVALLPIPHSSPVCERHALASGKACVETFHCF